MRYVDPDTWELRPATLREHAEVQIVGDALPNVHVMDALFSFTDLEGVPGIMQQLEGLANGLRYSVKPQHFGYMKDPISLRSGWLKRSVPRSMPRSTLPHRWRSETRLSRRFGDSLSWVGASGLRPVVVRVQRRQAPLPASIVQSWAGTIAFIVITQLIHRGHAARPASLRRRGAHQVGPRPLVRPGDLVLACHEQPAVPPSTECL